MARALRPLSELDPEWAWAPYEPDVERPWDRGLAAHLHRRAGFGATSAELDEAVRLGPAGAVAALLDAVEPEAYRQQTLDLRAAALASGGVSAGAAWWLHRLVTSPAQALEKQTLFWHGHFATGADKVDELPLMIAQNDLLRRHALGSFASLAHDISRDPAMLIYLDSATNRRAHPNENYARELMELFCLGEGNYTEHDVQQLARCFTGWEVRRDKFRFNSYQADTGSKSLLGREGTYDGDQAIDIVLAQPSLGGFLAGKLVRYYCFDEPAAPTKLLAPLAATLRGPELSLRPLVERILRSNLFFSEHSVGRKFRSPIELTVCLLRTLEGSTDVTALSQRLRDLGHGLFYPPNVKGWDGGRAWINTATLLARDNLVRELLDNPRTRWGGGRTLRELFESLGLAGSQGVVDGLAGLLMAAPPPAQVRGQLLSLAEGMADPEPRWRQLLYGLATLPEFQLH